MYILIAILFKDFIMKFFLLQRFLWCIMKPYLLAIYLLGPAEPRYFYYGLFLSKYGAEESESVIVKNISRAFIVLTVLAHFFLLSVLVFFLWGDCYWNIPFLKPITPSCYLTHTRAIMQWCGLMYPDPQNVMNPDPDRI